ncbi:hypothetical protein Bca4012_018791 [Brassica carinata]
MLIWGWDPGTHEEIRNREDLNHKIGEIWDQKAALEIWIYGNGRRLQCIWPARKSKMEMRNAKNQSQDCQGMSFGQLVGKTGELKNGEANRKRLKISVPHFDNSDLIKSYSRTLIGRCMNPDEQVVKSLLMMLPKIWMTTDVDLDHGKIRVVLDGFKELCFETTVDFTGGEFYDGEEVVVSLKYEKLFGFCKTCFSLCHHEDLCPLSTKSPAKKKDSKEDIENRRDDRARSYKGVLLHGGAAHQETAKEYKGYHGKGKGKMYQEQDTKWVKTSERGNKRPYSNRGSNRFVEGGSRHRSSRREQPRNQPQEVRDRIYRDARRPRSPLGNIREDMKEEGEIQNSEGPKRVSQRQEEFSTAPITVPEMQQEQNTISNTDAEVNAKSMVLEYGPSTELVDVNMEKDPKLVKESVEFGKDNLDDVVMDIDDSGINMEGTEELVSGDEDFQNLTDGEMEDLNIVQEDTGGNTEGVPPTGETGDEELLEGNEEKKRGTRKALFKPPALVVGTSKKMFVQAILSPRKKVQGKTALDFFPWNDLRTIGLVRYNVYDLLPWIKRNISACLLQQKLHLISSNQEQFQIAFLVQGNITYPNAAYLREKRGLDVVKAVLRTLMETGYSNGKTKTKVMIQSTNSLVLVDFKEQSKYETVYKIEKTISDIRDHALEEIKQFSNAVVIQKLSVFSLFDFFITGQTNVVERLQKFKLPVYVELFQNEFVSQPYDFFSDPTVEINSYITGVGINGIITEFPFTAARYRRNRCLGEKEPPPLYMAPVGPGNFVPLFSALPPAEAPTPVFTGDDVSAYDHYKRCSQPFRCGDQGGLLYPFWIPEREACGNLGFNLDCSSGFAEITVSSVKFRILKTNYTPRIIRLARSDYIENLCPSNPLNGPFLQNALQLPTDTDLLIMLYGCKDLSSLIFSSQVYNYATEFHCKDQIEGVRNYCVVINSSSTLFSGRDGFDNLKNNCTKDVSMPVSGSKLHSLKKTLEQGFELELKQDCSMCLESKGACGYNQASGGGFVCYWSLVNVIGKGSVAGVVIFLVLLALCLFLRKREVRKRQQNLKSLIPLKQYTYAQVKRITKSFAEVVGRGGFGIVYRGTLPDGRMVAVKSALSLLDTRGTVGYIAPEMISRVYGSVSHKSNVYSYGMLVLEMIGARNKEKAQQDCASNTSSIYFPEWIYRDIELGKSRSLIENEINNEEHELAKKMALVGLWCIQSSPLDRPLMNRVVEMMEGRMDALEVPPRPALQIPIATLQESSTLSRYISVCTQE